MNDIFKINIKASKSLPTSAFNSSNFFYYLGKCIFKEFKILNIAVAVGILKENPV